MIWFWGSLFVQTIVMWSIYLYHIIFKWWCFLLLDFHWYLVRLSELNLYIDWKIFKWYLVSLCGLCGLCYNLAVGDGHNPIHLKERVHIATYLGENFCHEVVYHKHEEIDYNVMKEEVIKLITDLLR